MSLGSLFCKSSKKNKFHRFIQSTNMSKINIHHEVLHQKAAGFLQVLFLVVVIAGAHGLWLLPAILSLVGGAKHSTELGAPEDPAKKTSKNQIKSSRLEMTGMCETRCVFLLGFKHVKTIFVKIGVQIIGVSIQLLVLTLRLKKQWTGTQDLGKIKAKEWCVNF